MGGEVGGLPTGDRGPLGRSTVDLAAAPPSSVAVLDVVPLADDSGERFGLRGFCCCENLPWTAPDRHRRPGRIDVATLISKDRGESPAQTFLRLKNWSSSKKELLGWLARLRDNHGEELRLIIRDCTDFGIPWELFWLADATGGDWLGSAVTVVRWVAMPRAADDAELPPGRSVADGGVIAYVADGTMRADRRATARSVGPARSFCSTARSRWPMWTPPG
jgi:hypothetical protein